MTKNKKYNKKGGSNYTSASSYGEYVNGSTNDQFNRTFSDGNQSNILIGAQGQNTNQMSVPTSQQLALIQDGGRRRRHKMSRRSKKRHHRGGLWGTIINQGAVPLTILGLQQNYKKKGGTKKRKNKCKNKYSRSHRGH